MKKTISALIFFLVLLTGAAVLSLNAAGLSVADYQEKFEKTLPLSAGGSFSLKNTNGDVIVSTWTKNEVEINAVKTAKRDKDDLNRVKIEVSAVGDSVKVDTIYEKTFLRNIRVEVNYEDLILQAGKSRGEVDSSSRFSTTAFLIRYRYCFHIFIP